MGRRPDALASVVVTAVSPNPYLLTPPPPTPQRAHAGRPDRKKSALQKRKPHRPPRRAAMAFFRAFVRAAAAVAGRAMLRRRVLPRPGPGIGVSRDAATSAARPWFRPREATDVVKEKDAAELSDVVAANLRQKVPRMRLSARLDLISEQLRLRLEGLPIEIDPAAAPLISAIVRRHLDAAAVALRDSISDEFKRQQANPNVFNYVSTRMAFLAHFLSSTASLLVMGVIAYYYFCPNRFHADVDGLIEQVVNCVWHAVTFGYVGETIEQRHQRLADERRAAEEERRRRELEELVRQSREANRQRAPQGLKNARGQGGDRATSRWDHSYEGMSSVGRREWRKSQR
ncbi:unnamed protein product [Urochloa humidicola]